MPRAEAGEHRKRGIPSFFRDFGGGFSASKIGASIVTYFLSGAPFFFIYTTKDPKV